MAWVWTATSVAGETIPSIFDSLAIFRTSLISVVLTTCGLVRQSCARDFPRKNQRRQSSKASLLGPLDDVALNAQFEAPSTKSV